MMSKSNSVTSAVNSKKSAIAADESNSLSMTKKIGILRKPVISKIPTINAIITPRPTARPQSQLTLKSSTVKGQGIFNRKKGDDFSRASSFPAVRHTSCMQRKSLEAVNQKQTVTPKSIFSKEILQKPSKTHVNNSSEKLKLERKIRATKKSSMNSKCPDQSLNFENKKITDSQAQITDLLLESKLSKLTGIEISYSNETSPIGDDESVLVNNLQESKKSLSQSNVQLSSVERIMRQTQKSASEFCQQFLNKNKEFFTLLMEKLHQQLSTQDIFDYFEKFEQQVYSEDCKQNGEISKFLSELENSILTSGENRSAVTIIELENECETLRNELIEQNKLKKLLDHQLIEFKQEISKKDIQIIELTETINSNVKYDENIELLKECESLRKASELTEQQISEKDAEIVRLIETINSISKLKYDANIELQKECESLLKSLESTEQNYQKNEHQLNEFRQNILEKDVEIVRLTETINGLQENLDNLNASSLDIVAQNKLLNELIFKADEKLNGYSEQLRINRMDYDKLVDLTQQLHAEQSQRSKADFELKNCQLEIRNLRNNHKQLLDTRYKECQLQQEKINRWKCAIDELKMEKQKFEKELISVIDDANHAKSQNLANTIEQITETNHSLKNQQKHLNDKRSIIQALKGIIRAVKNDRLEEYNKISPSGEIAFSQQNQQIEMLREELRQTLLELKNLKESIEMYKRLLIIRTAVINSMQQKEDTTTVELNELHEVIDQQSQTMKLLNVELHEKLEQQQCIVELLAEKDLRMEVQLNNFEKLKRAYKRIQESTAESDAKLTMIETENLHLKQYFEKIFNTKIFKEQVSK